MLEKRFDKLEDKFDKLDDKVDTLKEDFIELKSDVKYYITRVDKHVSGDDKIITEIQPTLEMFNRFVKEDLPEIKKVLESQEKKKIILEYKKIEESKSLKEKMTWKVNISILGAILSIIYTIYRLGWIKL